MPIYRYQDPPTRRECRQCYETKPTATEFDWSLGWPRTKCKECRRENDRARYADRSAAQTHRDLLNAQRRQRYARAKLRAAALVTYAALCAVDRQRVDAVAKKAQEAKKRAERLRAAKLTYGRWREREIRAGRMQRPPNVNPFTGKPRPTDDQIASRIAAKAEDAPRPQPPRWAELQAESDRVTAERLGQRSGVR